MNRIDGRVFGRGLGGRIRAPLLGMALWALVGVATSFGAINSVGFPSPAFRPPEGPQPPQPAAALSASQAVLTFVLNASPGRYRATAASERRPTQIVTTQLFTHSSPAGTPATHELAVPLEEGDNRFTITVQDLNVGLHNRTSPLSPRIVRDLETAVLTVTLDGVQPATRVTSGATVVLNYTVNGTAASYQIDVIRNAASATSFTTDRAGSANVTVTLAPNTSNDFYLRATANDPLAAGRQVVSNIVTVVADTQLPVLSNVSIFPGPSTNNAVVNVIGQTEPFSKILVNNGGGKSFTAESDLAGNFVVLGVGVPFVPPGPTPSTFTVTAIDQAGNRSVPFTRVITRQAADPRFEFLELSPASGSAVKPGTPIHIRGSVGDLSAPFTVRFYIRQTTGSFQLEERITNLAAGEAFEKDFHLTADVSNPNKDVVYSVEAQVESTAGVSPRQLAGEVVLDTSEPQAGQFGNELDQLRITNAPRVILNGAAEQASLVHLSAFPGILFFPASRIAVDSTPIVVGGEFRAVVDISKVADGIYPVATTVVASSGRTSVPDSQREVRLQRDTVPPAIVATSVNGRQISSIKREFAKDSQFVTLRIEYSEPMAEGPEVLVTQRGSFALPAALAATILPDRIFEYSYVTLAGHDFDGPAEVVVTAGRDRAGNTIKPELRFPGIFNVDTRPPVIDPANTRPAPGSLISSAPAPLIISILENPDSLEPASGVDIQGSEIHVFGPLETQPTRELRGFQNVFSPQSVSFEFEPGQMVEQGTYQVRVTVRDLAGNSDTENLIYRLDSEPIPPVFLARTVPPAGAILNGSTLPSDGSGRTVLSAVMSPLVTQELDLARSRLTLDQACPANRSYHGTMRTTPPDTFSLVLDQPLAKDGADDGQYLLRAYPRDTAGNETPAILRSFVYDTQLPAIEDGMLIEQGRYGNSTQASFFPAEGQLVSGPLMAVRAGLADGVAKNGYPGSGPNTSLTTGARMVLTLLQRHPTTLGSLPAGASTSNTALLTSVVRFRDIVPAVTSPCYTGVKHANMLLELRVDPVSGRPLGLTTGGGFDGRWEIWAFPVDQAGNNGRPSRATFILDTVAPRVLTIEGITSGEVFTGRDLAISGSVADNDKTTDDAGQGIRDVRVGLYRADAGFVTTGAPLILPTTATLAPNAALVQAETVIHYLFSGRLPAYNGNAILLIEATDVAGNKTSVVRQFTVQNQALERPVLSAPPQEWSTGGPVNEFRWTQVPGASGYRVTITDPLGNPTVRDTERDEPILRINLNQMVEGRYTWTVAALDTSGQPGLPALARAFSLDVTRPRVLEIFAYDAVVPDAHAGEILDGQIRIGVRFDQTMDPARPPTVTLRPANPRLAEVTVRQIAYDAASWRGLVDIQPDAGAPDYNGVALVNVCCARDLSGNVMEVTSAAFEVDVGPYWQVRAFANPIQRKELVFHLKALTQENGVPERIESLPLLSVTQPGAPRVEVPMLRRGEAVFAGTYTINQSFPGDAVLAITGSDTRGNTSTRLVNFSITAIIAANRTVVTLPAKAGSLELPAGSASGDEALAALPVSLAGSDSVAAAARQAGLIPIATVASFAPEAVRLAAGGEFSVDLARFPEAAAHPKASLGLYREEGGRYLYQPGTVENGVLRGKLDGVSRLELMADVTAPAVTVERPGAGGGVELESEAAPIRVKVAELGSGLDAGRCGAKLDGEAAEWSYDAAVATLTIVPRRGLSKGRHELSVTLLDRAGNRAETTLSAVSPGRPELEQAVAVPNPAKVTSAIHYRLSAAGQSASVRVFDAAGRLIYSAEGTAAAGDNSIEWPLFDRDGSLVANGVYLARVRVETGTGSALKAVVKIAVLR